MDNMGQDIWEDWRDEPMVIALYLAVLYTASVNANPKATPSSPKTVLELANKFHNWLA